MQVNGIYGLLANRFKAKMEQNQLTQMQVGKLLGWEQNKISRIINGKTRVTFEDYHKFALRFDPEYISKMIELFGNDYYILCKRSGFNRRRMERVLQENQYALPFEFLNPSSHISHDKETHPGKSGSVNRLLSLLHIAAGTWLTAAFTSHISQVCGLFQCESSLACGACA